MKIAVLGPICKDYIKVDNNLKLQMGGIPYYISHALNNLGVAQVTPFITFNEQDKNWVKDNFKNIEFVHIPAEKTLEFHRLYYSDNPDLCVSIEINHSINIISSNLRLLKDLEGFDYIILSPLFNENVSEDIFEKLKHKKLVLGNFGIFTYANNGKLIQRNPEKLIKLLPFLTYLFLDENEAKFVSGVVGTIEEVGNFFIRKGVDNMIITNGSKGSHIFHNQDHYEISAYKPNNLVDPTGAGDTYLAAFIRATELFNDLEDIGKFAAIVATISLENRGAFNGNIEDVKNRLSAQ